MKNENPLTLTPKPTPTSGRYQSGQMGQTVNLLAKPSEVRILLSPHTHSHFHHTHTRFAEVAHLVERKPSKLQVAGSSPVFRSNTYTTLTLLLTPHSHHTHTSVTLKPACRQAGPHPLRRCSSVVEHFLGKEGVMSSTLIIGSTSINKKSKL